MAKHNAKQLGLTLARLPNSIVEVISTLNKAGFEAYIVGGGVRDSLLGLAPKDFDAVTNARPQEIKQIFGGRCRIIGRRFQLAHVYSGREMIEVATFRAPPLDNTHTTADGMITRDNVWGDIEQDFARRDFSINALYYNPIKGEVRDFCGALDDITTKTLRLLGKASVRIEEDPVRLLRALRFKAKLGFEFDKKLAKQFHAENWTLLEQVSTHRLYDETQKMFSGGYLTQLLPLLYQYGAIKALTPFVHKNPTKLMMHVAKTTDERVNNERGANPAYFYAAMLWEEYLFQLEKHKKKLSFYEAQQKAAVKVIERQRIRTAIPKFAEEFISQIWWLQPKLVAPKASEIDTLINHPRFRAAYDFLVAREISDDFPLSEPTNDMGQWWTQYQLFDSKGQQKLIDILNPNGRRRSRKRLEPTLDIHAELEQLHRLGLPNHSKNTPKPLFDNPNNQPLPKKRIKEDLVIMPLTPVNYSQEDFMTLLSDEPFIPSKRRRHSSHVSSIKSNRLPTQTTKKSSTKNDLNPKDKSSKQSIQEIDTMTNDVKKPKKHSKKSNAKSRAGESE